MLKTIFDTCYNCRKVKEMLDDGQHLCQDCRIKRLTRMAEVFGDDEPEIDDAVENKQTKNELGL